MREFEKEGIYVANQINDTIDIKDEITQNELDHLNSAFIIYGIYHSITQIKDIVVENGENFQEYMQPDNLQSIRKEKVSPERIIVLANKYVFNYATSLTTFIDMAKRLLAQNKSQSDVDLFNSSCSKLYDQYMEYRFWMSFRNYIVHCDFPYHSYWEGENEPCKVVCEKNHLLQYKKWKKVVKADILNMDDEINLPSMVSPMSGMILAIYTNFFYFFADDIIDGMKILGEFCRKYEVTSPIIVKTKNLKDMSGATLQPVPIDCLREAYNLLKSNPNIEIKIID